MWIKNIVDDLIVKYQTNNPFIIAKEKNIYVIERDLHEDIYGFYRNVRRNKFIFINSNLNEDKKLFVCHHELGHVILHPDVNTPFMKSNTHLSVDKMEREANRFAVEMLISDKDIYKFNNLHQVASLYDIPVEIVRLKHCCKEGLL